MASTERIEVVESVPTFAELGLPNIQSYTFVLLMVLAGTPQPIITALNDAVIEEISGARGKPKLTPPGRESPPMKPSDIEAFLKNEHVRWSKIITAAGLKSD